MLITNDYILPAELTGYVRQALADLNRNKFTLSSHLPDKVIDDLDYRVSRGGQGLVDAGVYRSYDTESPIISRPGVTRIAGELAPMSGKIRLDEYSRLRQRKLDSEIRNQILNDAERLVGGLAARVELARGDLLTNGSVTISENGVSATVDFGRTGGHNVTLSGDDLWDDADNLSDPIAKLLEWRQTYVDANGEEPGVIVTSRKVLSTLMRNQAFRDFVYPTSSTSPSIVTEASVSQVLTAYGLPSIELYDVKVNVAGSATRVLPENRLYFLPKGGGQLGTTLWGTTAEALDADFGVDSTQAPGIVAASYSTKDPVALWTKASAIALPVLPNPDLSFVAKVIA